MTVHYLPFVIIVRLCSYNKYFNKKKKVNKKNIYNLYILAIYV